MRNAKSRRFWKRHSSRRHNQQPTTQGTNRRNIYIAGSSHAGGLPKQLRDICVRNGFPVTTTGLSLPGATVNRLAISLQYTDLSAYDTIILLVGGNNLFSKTGQKQTPSKVTADQLNALSNQLQSRGLNVIITPLLPRMTASNPNLPWSHLKHSHFKTFNGLVRYINRHLESPIKDELKPLHARYYTYLKTDGVHLNQAGKDFLIQTWFTYLAKTWN